MTASTGDIRGPVVILAPVEGDAPAVSQALTHGGFTVRICEDVRSFTDSLTHDAGAVVVAEEALTIPGEAQRLATALALQPDWSDLPIILLAAPGANEDTAWALARGLESVGNITILERPLRRSTLLNAVGVALRARARQHELRDHKEGLEKTVRDRTAQLTESMEHLQARERLAALGTLAAGLGHDIANLVLPIRMRLESLAAECSTEQARTDTTAIGTILSYLTNLSAGLRLMSLDPSREGSSDCIDDLRWWWSEVHGVFRGVLPRHVRLEDDLPPGIGVRVSSHRLTQAVFNLVQNAGEALAGRTDGVVRVAAERLAPPGAPSVVRLRISDNGPGMTPDVIRRCFEPYFSTKGRAIATGMGLGMARGVAESAGGAIEVHSEPGRGTTFSLTLPAVDHPDAATSVRTIWASTRTAALSIPEARTAAIAAMLLEGLDLKVVRHSGSSPADASLWIAQDPPRPWVEDFLGRCPGASVVVLSSQGAESLLPAGGADQLARRNISVLPLSAPPSVLRQTLIAAVRSNVVVTGVRAT